MRQRPSGWVKERSKARCIFFLIVAPIGSRYSGVTDSRAS